MANGHLRRHDLVRTVFYWIIKSLDWTGLDFAVRSTHCVARRSPFSLYGKSMVIEWTFAVDFRNWHNWNCDRVHLLLYERLRGVRGGQNHHHRRRLALSVRFNVNYDSYRLSLSLHLSSFIRFIIFIFLSSFLGCASSRGFQLTAREGFLSYSKTSNDSETSEAIDISKSWAARRGAATVGSLITFVLSN